MFVFLEIFVVVILFLVLIQDLKYRAIHMALPLFLCVIGMYQYIEKGYELTLLLWNVCFLGITLGGAYMYVVVKNKKFINPFMSAIGLGDILFFVAVLPFFYLVNYMLYFVTGLIFSIFCFLLLKLVKKTDLVPLAGFLALYMLLIKSVGWITDSDYFFTPPIPLY